VFFPPERFRRSPSSLCGLEQCHEVKAAEYQSWLVPYKAQRGSWRPEERISPDQPCNARRAGHEVSLEHTELAGNLQQVLVNVFTSTLAQKQRHVLVLLFQKRSTHQGSNHRCTLELSTSSPLLCGMMSLPSVSLIIFNQGQNSNKNMQIRDSKQHLLTALALPV